MTFRICDGCGCIQESDGACAVCGSEGVHDDSEVEHEDVRAESDGVQGLATSA